VVSVCRADAPPRKGQRSACLSSPIYLVVLLSKPRKNINIYNFLPLSLTHTHSLSSFDCFCSVAVKERQFALEMDTAFGEKFDLKRLHKAFITSRQMIADRGYNVALEDELTFEKFENRFFADRESGQYAFPPFVAACSNSSLSLFHSVSVFHSLSLIVIIGIPLAARKWQALL
jgi:hypothetical protein